jgi:hypothetical protein
VIILRCLSSGHGDEISGLYCDQCGAVQELRGLSGVVESPNFPQPYPHNRNCSWTIRGRQATLPSFCKLVCDHSHLALYDFIMAIGGCLPFFCGGGWLRVKLNIFKCRISENLVACCVQRLVATASTSPSPTSSWSNTIPATPTALTTT